MTDLVRLLWHAVDEESGERCTVYAGGPGLVVAPAPEFRYGPIFLPLQVQRRLRWLRGRLRRDPALPRGIRADATAIRAASVRSVRVEAPLHVKPLLDVDGRRFRARRYDDYDAEAWRAALVPVFGERVTFDDGPRRRWEAGR